MVFVFGTLCIDRIRRVPNLPSPGGYVEVEEEILMLGGEAANTATALIAWSSDIRLAGNDLGSGIEAQLLRRLIIDKGLPTELLGTCEDRVSPVCDIYITPDGERTMFGLGFSRANPSKALDSLPYRAGEWFTAEPNMGDRAREAARRAAQAGMRLYLMDFIRDDDPILAGSFWQSSTDWAGFRNNTQKNVRWVQEFVASRGCFCILSDGPNGFVAGSPEHPPRAFPPFPAPVVVDTTGAGDMFRAGMLYGLDRGWPIDDCLRFAAAAGCLKCRGLGATSYVPKVDEVEAHIAAHPEVARSYS
ncbi:MAG TPA: carbohydrate kinase family protein [Fimbriimonas sp.]